MRRRQDSNLQTFTGAGFRNQCLANSAHSSFLSRGTQTRTEIKSSQRTRAAIALCPALAIFLPYHFFQKNQYFIDFAAASS